jgi:hypothetical protein
MCIIYTPNIKLIKKMDFLIKLILKEVVFLKINLKEEKEKKFLM